jgi:hypothetical protein
VTDYSRLPWWIQPGEAAEVNWPGHDPPAVWKSWGLRGGGLPYVEAMHGAPVTKPRYGASADDGLPTLEPYIGGQSAIVHVVWGEAGEAAGQASGPSCPDAHVAE